jgi:hypothetical protein
MFSLKGSQCCKPIFTMISLAVLIGLMGQNLLAQLGRLPTGNEGITVQYGTDTAAPGIQYQELPSNEELGVDINHYIGDPATSDPYLSLGGIITRSILTHGDPLSLGEPGAILEYRKALTVGELPAGDQTSLVELPDQIFLYVESGEGRLEDSREYWDLREAIAALIPPHAKYRFVNTSDKPLRILMLTWDEPKSVKPRKDILVRDSHVLNYLSVGHWNFMSKLLFLPVDGMGPTEGISICYMAPITISAPHAHPPHHEELWVKLPPADRTYLFLGSEVRRMTANMAYLAPVNGTITHSNMNLSDHVEAWIGTNYWGEMGPTSGWQTLPDQPSVAPKPLKSE